MSQVYFVAAGTRGIGLELVKQLTEKYPDATVITSARSKKESDLTKLAASNPKVKVLTLDVSSQESIDELPAQLKEVAPTGIDVYIHNAGVDEPAAQTNIFGAARDVYERHYITNTLGAIFTAKAVYPFLKQRDTKKIIFISSVAGSLTETPFPTSAYGQSKAALNHSARLLADDLKDEGFIVIGLHPGVVHTEMADSVIPFLKKLRPEIAAVVDSYFIETDESVKGQLEVYSKLTKEDNGKFFNYDGSAISW